MWELMSQERWGACPPTVTFSHLRSGVGEDGTRTGYIHMPVGPDSQSTPLQSPFYGKVSIESWLTVPKAGMFLPYKYWVFISNVGNCNMVIYRFICHKLERLWGKPSKLIYIWSNNNMAVISEEKYVYAFSATSTFTGLGVKTARPLFKGLWSSVSARQASVFWFFFYSKPASVFHSLSTCIPCPQAVFLSSWLQAKKEERISA